MLVGLAMGAWGQADMQGQWSTLNYSMTINPIHVALMRNGKILVVTGSGNCPPSQSGCPSGAPYGGSNASGAVVLDPVAKSINQLSVSWDMFCNSMTVLADGRVMVNGGTLAYDPFHGSQRTSLFDPATNAFTDVQSMAHGRWYPTVTLLSDGRVMTFSGFNETGGTNQAVEIYTPGTGWSAQFNAPWTPPLYPRQHLLPNGNVFVSGPQPTTYTFNPSNQSWTTIGNTNLGSTRTYGSSVLLPLTPANNYDPKVLILGGGTTATASTELIDLGASSPAWSFGPDMSQARIEMDAVILPTGKVLALGGSSSDEVASTHSRNADLYDPDSNSFTSAGANAFDRLYHSVALLLPDATVWIAGSNPLRGTWESHMEIYQPAYLFTRDGSNNLISATRPTIGSTPANIAWSGQFSVSTPDAATISQAVLVRPGSSTHAFDMDQRLVGMSFTAGSGSLTVTGPPNSKIAPPGYYMLFLINNKGVPSTAKFVLLGSTGSNPAPTVTSISPSSGTAAGGTPVTITGTGFLAGATVKLGGTTATGVSVVSSTSITATTPAHAAGAVSVVVTNTDSQSGTLSNGYTYTSSNPAPTVSTIAPATGTAAGGTAVTITGTGFLTGATVKLGGTAATGVTVVSSTSITATTPAHAAGAVDVVVTNTDAQSGTLSGGYTYTSSGGGGGISFVQVKSATATSASSITAAFTAAQTAGNLNVVAVMWGDTTSTVSSVTDSRSNAYTLAVGPSAANGLTSAIYYAKNIAAGSNTVTVTFNKAAGWPNINVMEYSGLDTATPLDVVSSASGSGTTANSGSATTTSATELIVGAGNPVTTFTAAGSGFSNRIINSFGGISEDKIVTSTGSYNATATMTSGGWIMQMAAFRASGQGGSNPAPTVSTISPATGTAAGGTAVTITGTGFLAGTTIKLGGTAATGVNVASSTSITATTPAHTAGAVNVVVTNTDSQSGTLANGYTYTNPAPTVSTISPATGAAAGGTSVTITGTGFLTGATVKLGGTTATGVTVVSSTSITATTPAHAAGAVDVVVTNTDAQSGTLPGGFTYASNPAPTVTMISPATGAAAGGTAVTITGTGFLTGATVKLGGTAATGVTLVSSTSITATTPAHAAGAVDVLVTNTDTQSGTLSGGYTYTSSNPAPTVSTISPNTGTAAGGTAVTITGTGFLTGATVSLGGTAATGVTVVSSTSITATTPAHGAGAVNVVVTNTDAQSGTLTSGYTYTSSGGGGTISFVQVKSATATSGSSVSATFAAPQTVGNLNVVAVMWGDTTSSVTSVTDSRGNVYALAVGPSTATGLTSAIYFAKSITAGTNTVTVTFNQSAGWPNINVMEYSGLSTTSPLDVTATASGTGTTANSGSATTTAANELIVGAGNPLTTFTAAGAGFSNRIINSFGGISEDKIVSTAGSYNATATMTSGGWIMQMATFKTTP